MSRMGIRPEGGDSRFYCPARDIAHMGPALIGRALDDLDHSYWGVWATQLTKGGFQGVSEDAICNIALAIAKFFQLVNSESTDDMRSAWEKSHLTALTAASPAASAIVFGLIGQRFLFGVFNGLRDVTLLEDPEYTTNTKKFVARIEIMCAWLTLPWWRRVVYSFLPSSLRHRRLRDWWERRPFPRITP